MEAGLKPPYQSLNQHDSRRMIASLIETKTKTDNSQCRGLRVRGSFMRAKLTSLVGRQYAFDLAPMTDLEHKVMDISGDDRSLEL